MTQQPYAGGYPVQPQPPYGGGYPVQPQPPYGGGYPVQPQPPQPVADPGFTENEFFTRSSGGVGGPSFKFEPVPGSGVLGLIVDQKIVPKTQPNNPNQQLDKNGAPLWQLRVVLQTNLRNWEGVAKLPTAEDGVTPLHPSMDTGLRSVYVWYTMRDAIDAALTAANTDHLVVGMELGVKVTGTEPNRMGGNPIKTYAAIYRPPSGAIQPAPTPAPAPPVQPQQPQYAPPQQASAPPVQPGPVQQFNQAMAQPQYAPPVQQPVGPGQQTSAPPF